ncbi:mycofactocin-coupled SDR family oxidoreductase [Nocardioides sp. NPDC047086]|uniref:mycofactocin-coupled SDR family oxidoreductase n=1 Tax=Nocardioides sp. NPDC047086 TaxID=3154810 RepID=UPI0033F9B0F8
MKTDAASTETVTRVALVTGAARGIGAATARALVAEGVHVVALDWCAGEDSPAGYPQATKADLDTLVASLPAGRVEPVVGDVRDPAAPAAAVGVATDRWGRLDIAVAAAAVIAGGRPLWEDDSLDLQWQIDVAGVWNTATAAVPAMLAGPDPSGCRFVALASAAGSRGLFHLAAYNAAKHAVVGLVKGLAADLAGTGVTACAVSPGSTDTAMLAATADLYSVTPADLAAHQLLRRPLTPEEVAATVVHACSRAGAVLNGSDVAANGGFGG